MTINRWTLLIAFVSGCSLAQEKSGSFEIESVIESIVDGNEDEQSVFQTIDEIEYLKQHPVNLATAQYGDLLRIPFISPMVAEAILLFRDTVAIESIDQLLTIPIISNELLSRVEPFVIVRTEKENDFIEILYPERVDMRTRMERRIPDQKGYITGRYQGDKNGLIQRSRIGNKYLEIGGLLKKDAGELYSNGFLAGYLSFTNVSRIKKLVIGNYSVAADQGLVLSKNIGITKGINSVSQIKLRNGGVVPALSGDEYRYFQGIAATVGNDNSQVSAFYSHRTLHATVNQQGLATSLYTSGLFRTESEIQKKNTLDEIVFGGRMETILGETNALSFNVVRIRYGRDVSPELYALASNRTITVAGMGVNTRIGTINGFGEIATNDGDRYSSVLGFLFPVSKKFSMSYHHRSYTKGYSNPLARPLSNRSNISDGETGNYVGMNMTVERFSVASYVDRYSLYSVGGSFGTVGNDILLFVKYLATKKFTIIAQLKNSIRNQSGIRYFDDERSQSNGRLILSYDISRNLNLTQRFEVVAVRYAPSSYAEKGFLSFVEAKYNSRNTGISWRSRLVLFTTDSYDVRLYQYESEVPGNFSNPPLFGKGMRWYVVGVYALTEEVKMSFKYSETKKFEESVIGSGDDAIQGSFDNAVSLQLDFSF